ncbi:MAG: methyl-accepting chemotaxis protein, partial [Pseudomonadota bacterium]
MLNRLSISRRVLILASLPVLAATILGGIHIERLYRDWQTNRAVVDVVAIKPFVGDVVFELQRERGLSAILATDENRSPAFRKTLADQRKRTDTAIASYDDALAPWRQNLDGGSADPRVRLSQALATFYASIQNLGPLRDEVDRGSLAGRDVLARYNAVNDRAYDVLHVMISIATDPEIVRLTTDLAGVVHARNRLGLQRAIGGMVIVNKGRDTHLIRALLRERGMEMGLRSAALWTGGDARGASAKVPDREFGPMFDALIRRPDRVGFSAREWFDAASRKIDRYARVRSVAVDNLRGHAAMKEAAARKALLLAAGLGPLLAGFLLLAIVALLRSISRSVDSISEGLDAMMAGNLDRPMAVTRMAPEFQGLAQAIEMFRLGEHARQRAEEEAQQLALVADEEKTKKEALDQAQRKAERRRMKIVDQHIAAFESRAGEMMQALEDAAMELEHTARDLDGIADQTNNEAKTAHAASDEAWRHVMAVSCTSDGLATSLSAIRDVIGSASDAAGEAAEQAQNARRDAASLTDLAQQIDLIVNVIDEIAAKTNFLALNATIEAATAGAARGGFGIIAQELKALTRQTTSRAAEIGALVDAANELAATV